jgi:hypothetical protein
VLKKLGKELENEFMEVIQWLTHDQQMQVCSPQLRDVSTLAEGHVAQALQQSTPHGRCHCTVAHAGADREVHDQEAVHMHAMEAAQFARQEKTHVWTGRRWWSSRMSGRRCGGRASGSTWPALGTTTSSSEPAASARRREAAHA